VLGSFRSGQMLGDLGGSYLFRGDVLRGSDQLMDYAAVAGKGDALTHTQRTPPSGAYDPEFFVEVSGMYGVFKFCEDEFPVTRMNQVGVGEGSFSILLERPSGNRFVGAV